MDLAQLEVLVAVAEERSFSRAAARLRRTQPAVSQAVRRLEIELGRSLFDRSSKGGHLTDAGLTLLDYARRMLNLRRDAHGALAELSELRRGRVVVASNEYTMVHLLPVVEAFRRRHPEIRLEVRRSPASEIPADLLRRDVEVGVLSYRPEQAGLAAFELARDELALLVGPRHRLARAAEVSVKDLGGETFLAHNARSPSRERVVRAFARHKTPLDITVELPTLEAIKRLVERGLGVALMPRAVAAPEVDRGELVAIPVREMRLPRSILVAFRKGSGMSQAAAAFVAAARDARA